MVSMHAILIHCNGDNHKVSTVCVLDPSRAPGPLDHDFISFILRHDIAPFIFLLPPPATTRKHDYAPSPPSAQGVRSKLLTIWKTKPTLLSSPSPPGAQRAPDPGNIFRGSNKALLKRTQDLGLASSWMVHEAGLARYPYIIVQVCCYE